MNPMISTSRLAHAMMILAYDAAKDLDVVLLSIADKKERWDPGLYARAQLVQLHRKAVIMSDRAIAFARAADEADGLVSP